MYILRVIRRIYFGLSHELFYGAMPMAELYGLSQFLTKLFHAVYSPEEVVLNMQYQH